MEMKKILCTAVCAAVLGTGYLSCPVLALDAAGADGSRQSSTREKDGLLQEDGYYRYYEDGQAVKDRWITVGKQTYYFDGTGNASVLKCKIGGVYYVFDKEGRLLQPSVRKVIKVETKDGETKKYYVDTKGRAVSGWTEDKSYYFDKTGELVTGITVLNAKFYCFHAGGRYSREKTQKVRKAAVYEMPFSSLKKYIGNPQKARYYASCYGKGKDGILTYDGYTVYTFKPDSGSEIFMGAE